MSLFGGHREDELRVFVVIATGETAVWRAGENAGKSRYASCLYHATVDGLRPLCKARMVLGENDPYPSTYDRSNDLMTCKRCQELVRRRPLASQVSSETGTPEPVQGDPGLPPGSPPKAESEPVKALLPKRS